MVKTIPLALLTGTVVAAMLSLHHAQVQARTGPVSDAQPAVGAVKLKGFLAAPPCVEMVAEITEKAATSEGTNFYYALLRYQTNAFFYRAAPTLSDLSTTAVFPGFRLAGYHDNYYWSFSGDGRTIESTQHGEDSMRMTLEHVMRRASKVLNLGIFDALPGSIVWEGNMIRPLTNYANTALQGVVQGELRSLTNGQPGGLALVVESGESKVPWEIDYEFASSGSLPPFLPTRITAWSLRTGSRTFQFGVRLLEAHVSVKPLPRASFLPGALTQSVWYEVERRPDGLFTETRRSQKWPAFLTHALNKHWPKTAIVTIVTIGLVMLSVAVVVAWAARRKPRTK